MKKKAVLLICILLLATCVLAACSGTPCTVTLDAKGGTVENSSITARRGERLKAIPSATRDGWFFGGWYTQTEGGKAWDFNKDTVNGNMTLYARWHGQGVVVSYDLNLPQADIEHSETPQSVLLAKNAMIIKPVAPTAKGYIFRGWLDSDGKVWDFSTNIDKDMTLYASWVQSCKVTFDYLDERTSSVTVAKGDTYDELPGAARVGHVFGGWMSDKEGTIPFEGGKIEDDITLYAKWYEQSNAAFFSLDSSSLEINVEAVNDAAVDTLVLPNNMFGIEYTFLMANFDEDNNLLTMPTVKNLVLPACVTSVNMQMFPNLESVVVDYNNERLFTYNGALYEFSDSDSSTMAQLFWVRAKRGYTEIYPQTTNIYQDGVFFLRGFNENLDIYLSSTRVLIVEDEYYDAYYSTLSSTHAEYLLKYLLKLSDYETHGAIIADGNLYRYIGESEIVNVPQEVTYLSYHSLPNYVTEIHLNSLPGADILFSDTPLNPIKIYINIELDIDIDLSGMSLLGALDKGEYELIVLTEADRVKLQTYIDMRVPDKERFTVTARSEGVANA